MQKISNWGNYPAIDADVINFDSLDELKQKMSGRSSVIPRGNGRCYGDSALGETIVSTLKYNKLKSFDSETGEVECQSGALLADLLDVFVPRGWFLPVTPGTKLITIGGAIASNVHGKSHHVTGSFSNCVVSFELMLPSGEIKNCSRTENPELFVMTHGGMGLTGLILSAKIKLMPVETAYIRERIVKAANLDEIMDLFEASGDWTYSVAWIDCLSKGDNLGRSILMLGEHAKRSELTKPSHVEHPLDLKRGLQLNVPFMFPNFALNKLTMHAFNFAYYHKMFKKEVTHVTDYNTFFYPLDTVDNWNRIYGTRGFTQYQFVLPKEAGREGLRRILTRIADSGMGSFLAVLKLFGEEESFMSFPMAGYTLALDFPIKEGLFELLDELDEMVAEYGGRLYLTKDVRMNDETFFKTYQHADDFKAALATLGTDDQTFASLQSTRVGLTN
jgi:FAD/FMN-containing dehydrogenase